VTVSANQPGQPEYFGQNSEYFGQDKPNPVHCRSLPGLLQTRYSPLLACLRSMIWRRPPRPTQPSGDHYV
jgi:hypothetical protein